ncbi:ParB N-terminal domain-containing protein [Bombilactobacillus mellis]|uniref:ParB N-terminal domain-containing protein n=1 Tax=Bombilactobacillus mellis TaxID=1218508 RepID=UPI001580117F|nr:ParB N-terminal domain-containing protein [Bombilactobacillus mellis]NUF26347.1 ParB N-terminal domain-containing protein [Bombilactobacillus mellis]
MDVISMAISDIKPYPNNPRKNDDAVTATANSIKEFGWQQPIIVDKDNIIIAGHTRYKAAKQLNMDTVPVVVAKNLSKEQVKAYRLADNKTGEIAVWDYEFLDDELANIIDFDMEDFGFEQIKNDVNIDDIFFDDEEQQKKDNTLYLKWENKKVVVSQDTLLFLNNKLNEYKNAETNKETDFVQWLLKSEGAMVSEINVSRF